MRFLRMLSNAILGAALGAAYLTVLFLQLNPAFPLRIDQVVPLFGALALLYGVHLAAIFYVLMVVRQLFAAEMFSPGWISFRVLVRLATLACAGAALLTWMNLRGFSAVLEARTVREIAMGASATTLSALVLVLVAAVHDALGELARRLAAAVSVVAVLASLVVPLAVRLPASAPPGGARPQAVPLATSAPQARVHVIVVDGASLDYVSPAVAGGRLPNLGKMLDEGAAMHVATLRPTQPALVWTAAATGKLPYRTGVRSAATYGVAPDVAPVELLPDYCFAQGLVWFGIVTEAPNTATTLRARPFWRILSDSGVAVGVVGWPLTYPAEPVRGFLVSDQFHLKQQTLALQETPLAYPRDIVARAAVDARGWADPAAAGIGQDALAVLAPGRAEGVEIDPGSRLAPLSADQVYDRMADELRRVYDVQLLAVRYQGLDLIAHYFLRYAMPRSFGDVPDSEQVRFGHVLDQYYGVIDQAVGRAMAGLGPGDLLLVVSGFGMEPVTLGKRVLARLVGDPDVSGTHEHAPDGFLLAYGSIVARGRQPRGSVVDLAPTILYFLGLPVARDMDGHARADIFARAFTADRPITFIPSYDR